jgi:hypothetical protein
MEGKNQKDSKEIWRKCMDLMQVLQHRENWSAVVHTVVSSCAPRKAGSVLSM